MDSVLKIPDGEVVASALTVILAKSGNIYVFGPKLQTEGGLVVPEGMKPDILDTDLWLEMLLAGIKTAYNIASKQSEDKDFQVRRKKRVIAPPESMN